MNTKRNITICLLLILALSFSFIKCNPEDKDPIKFKIICTGAHFEGVYSIDGGQDIWFEDTENLGGNIYKYEKTIDELDDLRIIVTIESEQNASLTLEIYKDDDQVDYTTFNVDEDDEDRTLRYHYEYGEEEEEETSSD
ncbi:MAG: hypothetical protein SVR08_08705 [Spirochaetota bacterium]|nr:hypothetical protein [Spirochaetota bacterium]